MVKLEISRYGIRLLTRDDETTVKAVPLSLIHSWVPTKTSFRFFCTDR